MRGKLFSAIILITAVVCFGQSQTEQLKNVNVSSLKAVHLGKTKPVRELVRVSATDRDKKSKIKAQVTAKPQNFIGRQGSNARIPELEHQGPDPLRQLDNYSNLRAVASITPEINIDGNGNGSPNDPSGDVGLDYYVHAINATTIAVYDKTDGTLVDQFAANTLWSSINESSAGDPIILFDHEYDRWIITEFTSPFGSANLLFAISETSDPLGSYNAYAFSPPNFPDYPKWAIWNDYYFVTTNEQGPGALHQYFFDRAAFLAGEAEIPAQRVEIAGNTSTEAGFYVTTPVSWIGDTPPTDSNPIAVKINDSSWGEVENDVVEVYTFDVDLEGETTATLTSIVSTPFDGFPCDNANGQDFACLTQGGSSQGIDAIPEVIMNLPHYRNFGTHESIVLSFITDVTDGDNLAGIRWMELRRTDGDWTLYQEGTYAPDDGLHRFMPSISMDKDGNIGLAYNTTSSEEFVGVKFTGRYAEDDLGTMTVSEVDVVDGTTSIPGDRFGDYAQMAVDPVNERTFWYTTEYPSDNGSVSRIFSFTLEDNDNDLTLSSIDEPNTSASLTATETVSVTVDNIGTQDAINFDLILVVNDVTIETYTHSTNLAAGASLTHDFATTVDFSAFGDYLIGVEIDYTADEVTGNNFKSKTVTKLAENDASVAIDGLTSVCNDEVTIDVEITNEGELALESVDIQVSLNASLVETIEWTGSLEIGESEVEVINVSSLISGDNDISITLADPNEVTDEITGNNTADLSVNFDNTLDQVVFTVTTDEYPGETTWELRDSDGLVVLSGGPYADQFSTITEYLCLDPDACYEFEIFDSFDDGICCSFGEGSYSLEDSEGNIIFAGDGQFGSSEATNFCLGAECNLTATVDIVNESANALGSIVIDASGSYNYEYSIDGGETLQESPVFDELESGSYDVFVLAQNGNCEYEETVTVGFDCDLSISISEEKNGDNTGNIEITATGGDEYEYSVDGGETFQSSNVFSNLASGTYEIHVRSNDGQCVEIGEFTVDFVLGTSIENAITIAPNPTDGVFKISVPGHDYIKGFLEVDVIDLNGRIIQHHRFTRYDDSFEGTISLYAYPNGIYFLKLTNADSDRLVRIMKR
ncbi:CARDB domain-containing protein [Ekhidna sp.]